MGEASSGPYKKSAVGWDGWFFHSSSEVDCPFTNRAGHGSISVSLFVNLLEVDSPFFFVMASLGQDDTLVLLVYAIYTSYIITQFTYIYIYIYICIYIYIESKEV